CRERQKIELEVLNRPVKYARTGYRRPIAPVQFRTRRTTTLDPRAAPHPHARSSLDRASTAARDDLRSARLEVRRSIQHGNAAALAARLKIERSPDRRRSEPLAIYGLLPWVAFSR